MTEGLLSTFSVYWAAPRAEREKTLGVVELEGGRSQAL